MLSGLADPSSYYGYRFQNFDPNSVNVTQDPGYQFRLQQGLAGVQNSQAARGLQNSGGALKELMNYGRGSLRRNTATPTTANIRIGRGTSRTAPAGTASRECALESCQYGLRRNDPGEPAGQNYGNQYAAGQQGISEAKAAGIMGAQNALAGGFGNIGNLLKRAWPGASYYTGGLSALLTPLPGSG